MGLSALLTNLIEYVGDVIHNELGQPAPDSVFRYHGADGPPHDCCSEAGFITAGWERTYLSSIFPAPDANKTRPCAGPPATEIGIRFVKCWPVPDADETGVAVDYLAWDAASAVLAEVQDGVTRALTRLSCASPNQEPFLSTLVPAGVTQHFRFREARPIPPRGGCSGVLWLVAAAITRPGEAS